MNTGILAFAFILILGGCDSSKESSSNGSGSANAICERNSGLSCFEFDGSLPGVITGYKDSDHNGCCPKDIDIPRNFTEIADNAFASRGLTSVIIPDSVETIGENAFAGHSESIEITLSFSEGITEIPNDRFSGFPLTSVTIPSGVTSIGSSAFSDNQFFGYHSR